MGEQLAWYKLSTQALEALINQNLERASEWIGIELSPFFSTPEAVWLWEYRLKQVHQDAGVLDWMAQIVALETHAIGHAGFHAPPDETGMIEVAYAVVPADRGKGYAKAMLAHLLKKAEQEPAVKTVRATISPDNVASLATIRPFGFVQVGEQWDDVDGLELIFELTIVE